MKFPKTPDDVKNEILLSSDKYDNIADLRIRQLIKILPKVPDEIIVEGVIRVFEIQDRPEKLNLDQEFAGKVLARLNPKSQMDLIELIQRTLGNWNKSVEQLPFWVVDNYGTEEVKRIFDKIQRLGLSSIEEDKLSTMCWWVGIEKPVPNN